MRVAASRLWRDDLAYAERRYQLRTEQTDEASAFGIAPQRFTVATEAHCRHAEFGAGGWPT